MTRNLSRGASLDEVSAAVGHSSDGHAAGYYDHFVRRSFFPTLRSALALPKADGPAAYYAGTRIALFGCALRPDS